MRIAVLGIKTRPASAGADRVVEKLLETFEGDPGHAFTVYLMDRPDVDRLPDVPGMRHVYVPYVGGKHLAAFSYFLRCAVHAVRHRSDYDLLHVHNSDFGLFCPVLRLAGLPVLGTFHGDPYLRDKWGRFAKAFLRTSERFFVSACDHLTSVSRFKDRVRGIVGEKRTTYVPNGVDPYWNLPLTRSFDADAHELTNGEYLLFACGRLDPTKGLHHLLEGYRGSNRPERLLVVGDFSHDAAYAARIRELAAADPRVVLHPELLDRERLLDCVRGARAFVFPSEVEAMSMMLLEVVSCKTPVVCSDIPENLAVVGEDYAYAYPTFDAAGLRERLESMLTLGVGARAGISEALFERCMREFAWPTIADGYRRAYAELARDAAASSERTHPSGTPSRAA